MSKTLYTGASLTTLVLALSLSGVTSNFNGAPDNDLACYDLSPGHGLDGDVTPVPFQISVSQDFYNPGGSIQVTLESTGSTNFRGFIIQARQAGVDISDTDRFGSWDTGTGTSLTCADRGGSGNSLTHSPSQDRTSITVTWQAPASLVGDLQFRATFVQDYNIRYIDVKSVVISESGTAPSTTTTSPPTSPSTTQGTGIPDTTPTGGPTQSTTRGPPISQECPDLAGGTGVWVSITGSAQLRFLTHDGSGYIEGFYTYSGSTWFRFDGSVSTGPTFDFTTDVEEGQFIHGVSVCQSCVDSPPQLFVHAMVLETSHSGNRRWNQFLIRKKQECDVVESDIFIREN